MKKVLVITPHLSTGGAPQVTLNKIKLLKDEYIIKCVEYTFAAWNYVIQRNQIQEILSDNFHSLGDDKSDLINILNEFKPDIISMEEFPEFFMDDSITKELYSEKRNYVIFETTHDSSFPVKSKRWFPDKFLFVSAFNAFRYSIYDIPYDIVEYPVDYKFKNKNSSQTKLGLDPTYKHVLNVGLFTQRKNQGYIFEIAKRLKDYRIKFHFLGNQADNFKDYWEPLLNEKTDNCVIWGERNDVSTFIESSDLFLFPSKGDKNNKELNPIALKEALEYQIPMMMYNLDVYCGKYDKYENISFLTGDVEVDSDNLLKLLNTEITPVEIKSGEVIIISTYPDTTKRQTLTIDCIKSFRKLNRKIILVSHYPVSAEIQDMVDYYVFDDNNLMIPHSYYTHFYNNTSNYNVQININGLSKSNQSLAAHINFFNGVKLAKTIGADKFMIVTYDVILNELDIPLIEDYFNKLNNWNCCLSFMDNGIETTSMVFNTDYFIEKLSDINDEETFNNHCLSLGCHNFLENYYMSILKDEDYLWIVNNDEKTILPNSGLGVSSNSEYYSIVPINESKNDWMIYFFTYNLDNRRLEVILVENGVEIYNNTIIISETREYYKRVTYSGKPIDVIISFYDNDNLYKKEIYQLNDETIHTHFNNGFFNEVSKPERKPLKIKLLHLQTTINDLREVLSKESLEKVSNFGIEYVLHQNDVYESLPPQHSSIRPHNVRLEKYSDPNDPQYGNALTPAHYGCFDSFKMGIMSEFDKDLDFLIVCEGDCIIETTIEGFVDKIYEVCDIVNNEGIEYFSFGDTKTLDFGWHQSNVVREIPNQDLLFITDKVIGLQCIMFPIKTREYLLKNFRTHKWDCMDTFFNIIFSNKTIGILKNRITSQADGYSLIDKEYKNFN